MKIKPILMFTSLYKKDESLNREGVHNSFLLMKQALFTNSGLNMDENESCLIDNMDYVDTVTIIKEYLSNIQHDDIVLFYFCGHGFPNYKTNCVVLSTSDTTLKNSPYCGIKHTDVVEYFKTNGIKNYIIVLDCCQGGFLCGMGVDSVFQLNQSDTNTSNVIYISSTMREQNTLQKKIEDKYYIPFSYFFAKYLIDNSKSEYSAFSIHDIYSSVIQKLQEDETYPATCVNQVKGDYLWDADIFESPSRSSLRESSACLKSGIHFSDFFSITELKVLLVKTAIKHPISKYDDFGVPLGLWLLKGHLYTTGLSLSVDIYDERLELRKCNENEELKAKVTEQFRAVIEKYDVVGISMCSSEVFPAMEKFKICKEADKITFCGGIFTTSNERYLIESNLVDYVIPGVSTLPLTNLLAHLLQEKRQGKLGEEIVNEYYVASKSNIDQFGNPWEPYILPPMRLAVWNDIIDLYGDYLVDTKTGKKRMDVYTARGCEKNCSFCSVQKESRQNQFRKDTKCVIDEIKYLESKGIEYFSIKDEDFLSKPESIHNILEAVAKEGVRFKIRARYDEMIKLNISLEKLSLLGVDEIQYGIESPDFHLSRSVNKGFPRDAQKKELIDFIRKHAEYGITANCSFILGIYGEDLEYYDSLYDFITKIYDEKSKPKIYINFLTPHPINSSFPTQNYTLVTNNLNYFTHKYPVCFAQGASFGIKKKMLETYEKIVEYTNSQAYNPLNIPLSLKKAFFSSGNNKTNGIISLPQYNGEEDEIWLKKTT